MVRMNDIRGVGGIHNEFMVGEYRVGFDFPGIQDLASKRQDGLVFPVTGLLGGTTSRITFDQEEFGQRKVLAGAIGQFAGQGRAGSDFFTYDFFTGFEPVAGAFDGHSGQTFTRIRVLIQPQAERIFDHPGNKGRALTG